MHDRRRTYDNAQVAISGGQGRDLEKRVSGAVGRAVSKYDCGF